MKIDDNFHVTNDRYQWTLHFEGDPEERVAFGKLQEVRSTDKWYYSSLEMCLKKYKDEAIKPCESVDEILQKIEFLNQLIKNKFNDKQGDINR